jgi:hypothetical protein
MSIHAASITHPWSWPTGTGASASTNGTQSGVSAFQASLTRWQNGFATGTQSSTTASTGTQPEQSDTDGVQHRHRLYDTGSNQQISGSQTGGGDIASVLQSHGSGTTGSSAGSGSGSFQSDANTLIANAMQAYGSAQAAIGDPLTAL